MKSATRLMLALAVVFTLISVFPPQAEAYRRRRVRYTTYNVAIDYSEAKTDQDMCEAEAAYQAANYVYAHVGVNIGNFEGWGSGATPSCDTCTPGYGMTLTGDASCQASNGMWFRVRCWR